MDTTSTPPADPVTTSLAQPERPPFEQPTDDWRQVEYKVREYVPHDLGGYERDTGARYYKTQRRYLVATSAARYAPVDPPVDMKTGEEIPYLPAPGQPLWWFAVTSQWRDIPIVTQAQVAAERAEDKSETPKISTTT